MRKTSRTFFAMVFTQVALAAFLFAFPLQQPAYADGDGCCTTEGGTDGCWLTGQGEGCYGLGQCAPDGSGRCKRVGTDCQWTADSSCPHIGD